MKNSMLKWTFFYEKLCLNQQKNYTGSLGQTAIDFASFWVGERGVEYLPFLTLKNRHNLF